MSITQLHFITKSSYRAGQRCTRVDLRCEGKVSESLPVVGDPGGCLRRAHIIQ